jgi:hypothetical protein
MNIPEAAENIVRLANQGKKYSEEDKDIILKVIEMVLGRPLWFDVHFESFSAALCNLAGEPIGSTKVINSASRFYFMIFATKDINYSNISFLTNCGKWDCTIITFPIIHIQGPILV